MKTVKMRAPSFRDTRLNASQQQRDAWMERALAAEAKLAQHEARALDDGFDAWWITNYVMTVPNPNSFARHVWQAARRHNKEK